MSRRFDIGDRIICTESGVSGICEKFYYPTACEEQTMVETAGWQALSRTYKNMEESRCYYCNLLSKKQRTISYNPGTY